MVWRGSDTCAGAPNIVGACAVVFAGLFPVAACSGLTEPSPEGDGETAPSPPVLDAAPTIADPDAGRDANRWFGCSDLPPSLAGTVEGGASLATFLTLPGDDARTLHGPYPIGSFAADASEQAASVVCGDRGVYFADNGCGNVAVAACADTSVDGTRRPCIYLATHLGLRPEERKTTPAGHYVDPAGQCWTLVDAAITLEGSDGGRGGTVAGTFQVTAVHGAEQKILAGSFVACSAVTYENTCR